MFSGARDPIYGKQFQLAEPINSPAPLSRLPIMVGGGGEQVTLRLVAKYADACNLFTRYGPGGLARKLEVLREHCDAVGRDYDEIDRTSLGQWDPVRKGPQSIIEEIGHLHDLGFTTAIASVRDVDTLKPIEALGRDVVPFAAGL
jgi:alkanesulfonate monooxygenase